MCVCISWEIIFEYLLQVPDKIFYDRNGCWFPAASDAGDGSPDLMRDGDVATGITFDMTLHTDVKIVISSARNHAHNVFIIGPDLNCSPAGGLSVSAMRSDTMQMTVCLAYKPTSQTPTAMVTCRFRCHNDHNDVYVLSMKTTPRSVQPWQWAEIYIL